MRDIAGGRVWVKVVGVKGL